MYKCHLFNAEDLDDILDLINDEALRVVSCFHISDLRKVCVMTEEDDIQPVAEIIRMRKTRAKRRKLWQKR